MTRHSPRADQRKMGTGQMGHLQGSEAEEVSKYTERILRITKNIENRPIKSKNNQQAGHSLRADR